jgi:hypothetical protein
VERVIATLELIEMSYHGSHGIIVLRNRQGSKEDAFSFV